MIKYYDMYKVKHHHWQKELGWDSRPPFTLKNEVESSKIESSKNLVFGTGKEPSYSPPTFAGATTNDSYQQGPLLEVFKLVRVIVATNVGTDRSLVARYQ